MCRLRKNLACRHRRPRRCFRRRLHSASHRPMRHRHPSWAIRHPKRRHRRCSAKAGPLKASPRRGAQCPPSHSDRQSHLANHQTRRRTGRPHRPRNRWNHHRPASRHSNPDCRPRRQRRRKNHHFDRQRSRRTSRPGYHHPATKKACPSNRRHSRRRPPRAGRHRIGHRSGRRWAYCWKNHRRRPTSRHWSQKSHRTTRTSRRSACPRKAWTRKRIADRRNHPLEKRKRSSRARNGPRLSAHASA